MRIRELVRNALRMRPDRIIVGEVRGAETLDMLQAMNTGHEGSLTTIHANSPRDALSRLETLVLTAGVDLPLRAIREQIASAFDLLVQISRLVDGTRRVTHVTEVLRMEADVVTLQDIFVARPPDEERRRRLEVEAARRRSPCTGLKPHFLEKLAANGVVLPPSFFTSDSVGLRALRGDGVRTMRTRALVAALGAALIVAAPGGRFGAAERSRLDPSTRPSASTSSRTSPRRSRRGCSRTASRSRASSRRTWARRRASCSRSTARSRWRASRFADAIAAARAFVAAKPAADRIAVVAFGAEAVQLTGVLVLDDGRGQRAAHARRRRQAGNRAERRGSARLRVARERADRRARRDPADRRAQQLEDDAAQAVAAARLADVSVYPIAIEGPQFSPAALRLLAAATGGTYHGATSSAGLAAVYRQIAAELRRTWRVEYQTSAQPGARVSLLAKVPGAGSGRLAAVLGGSSAAAPQEQASHLLPYGTSGAARDRPRGRRADLPRRAAR